MSSLEKPKKTEPAKAKAVRKPKMKKVTGKVIKKTTKGKGLKAEQSVVVNVSTSKGNRKPRVNKSNLGNDPNPKFYQPAEVQSIASRQPLVNTIVNSTATDKNIVADPVKYLESSIPVAPTKPAVKSKKGQNPIKVEVQAQQEVTEVKPNAKGLGLAENVEKQTEVKIQVDKPKRKYTKKLDLEPVNQFVNTYGGNTDKVKAFDTQAEGEFEKNAEEGIEIKTPKVKKPRGRPPKEKKLPIFKDRNTEYDKAITKIVKKRNEEDKGEEFGKEFSSRVELGRLGKEFEKIKLTNNPISELQEHRTTEKYSHSKLFPQNEAYASKKYVDSSLGKLYENQFDDQVNYMNDTNNNPVKGNLAELSSFDVPADTDILVNSSSTNTNYTFA